MLRVLVGVEGESVKMLVLLQVGVVAHGESGNRREGNFSDYHFWDGDSKPCGGAFEERP